MKLKLFLIAASAMALASCSSDEVVQSNENANAIKFSVVANNAGRAADYWCNLNKPTEFQVWAKFDGKSYFAGDWFKDAAKTTYVERDGILRYWPEATAEKPVHFYAAKLNADDSSTAFATFNWTDGEGNLLPNPTISYNMATYLKSSEQHDLLYAYEKGKKLAMNQSQAINFRHALSQIVFKAKNTNKKIYVEISEVKIGNAIGAGTFTYPTATTTDNFENHAQATPNTKSGIGSWGNTADAFATFTTEAFTAIPVEYSASAVVNLTNNETEANIARSFLVIPTAAATTKWDTTTATAENKVGGSQTGSYFAFKVQIWNVSGNSVNKTGNTVNETMVYNNYMYIPYSFDWKPGKKYIYTINFTQSGHGGYQEDGKEVLVPIQFTCTVDDFDDATNQAVEIDAEGNKLAPANP